MDGMGIALRSAAFALAAGLLTACAHAPSAPNGQIWTYLGNDPDGTQNIYVQDLQRRKGTDLVTGLFRFEFTGPRDLTTSDLKQVTYVERRDRIEVDCKSQNLQLLDETYNDVDDKQV